MVEVLVLIGLILGGGPEPVADEAGGAARDSNTGTAGPA
jgi:hypothetical protein